jgi:hypothetical protein
MCRLQALAWRKDGTEDLEEVPILGVGTGRGRGRHRQRVGGAEVEVEERGRRWRMMGWRYK